MGTQHAVRRQTKIQNTKQKTKKLSITDPIKNLGIKNGQSIGHTAYMQTKNTQDGTLITLISGGEHRCSRRVRSFSILRDTRHGTHICFKVIYDTSMRNKANNTNKINYFLLPNGDKDETGHRLYAEMVTDIRMSK